MADRFPGQITIGGTIKTPEDLVAMATAANASVRSSWGVAYMTFDDFINEVFASATAKITLVLQDENARYGSFEDLEDALVDADVGFIRHSSARYEYDAEITSFTPGKDSQPVTRLSTEAMSPVMELSALRQAMAAGKSLQEVIDDLQVPTLPPLSLAFDRDALTSYTAHTY